MHAFRSPFRLFVIGVVGLVLVLAAIDIMYVHEFSTPPDGAPDALTTRGLAQQRADIFWGAALMGLGAVLVGSSLVDLFRRRPVVDVRDDGLYARVGADNPDVLIPWEAIADVSSGVDTDQFDGSARHKLIVTVHDAGSVPEAVAGAAWHGNELHIDASDWSRSVTDIALAAQGARANALRPPPSAVPSSGGAPSLMWETRVDHTSERIIDADVTPTIGGEKGTGGDA
ncbi:MAG: hypothetical protein R2823_02315 [Acidimicrobiia bacterium]